MRDPAPWQKRYGYMLLYACLIGLVSQYLFVGKAAGVSVVLFILGFYGIFLYAVQGRLGGFDQWKGQAFIGWLLLVPVGLLTMTYMLYANSLFRVLNAFALPVLVAAQTMLVTGNGGVYQRGIGFMRNVFVQLIVRPIAHIAVPFSMVKSWLPQHSNGHAVDSKWNSMRKVLIGLLLASPLLFIVIALLASADPIFQSWLAAIPHLFDGLSSGDGIARIGVAVVVSLYIFGYLWGLLFPKMAEVTEEEWADFKLPEREKLSFDPVIAGTLLISVNVVYALFAVIQFSYLFGAANGLLPSDAAYAEYARKGFAELVLVTLINLGLLMVGLYYIRRAGNKAEAIRKLLLSLLVLFTVVMLISAYSRLSLYEDAYGFTQTRLLVHGFMLFLGVLLAIALYRIWQERFSLSKAYLLSALIAYVIMNYANLDDRIASNNSVRYERSGVIDMAYLGKLSTDAAPSLIKLHSKHPDLPGLEEAIADLRSQANKDNKWPSWNVSKWRAR
ncbi:hypothetical protein D3C73_492090 [compost metagenome]